jgi:hypothetical protein
VVRAPFRLQQNGVFVLTRLAWAASARLPGSKKWPAFDPAPAAHAAFFFGAINLRLTKTSAI